MRFLNLMKCASNAAIFYFAAVGVKLSCGGGSASLGMIGAAGAGLLYGMAAVTVLIAVFSTLFASDELIEEVMKK